MTNALSDSWRVTHSQMKDVELANVLQSLNRIAGAAFGMNKDNAAIIQYASKNQSDSNLELNRIRINPTFALKSTPVRNEDFDVLCGETIHECGHFLADSIKVISDAAYWDKYIPQVKPYPKKKTPGWKTSHERRRTGRRPSQQTQDADFYNSLVAPLWFYSDKLPTLWQLASLLEEWYIDKKLFRQRPILQEYISRSRRAHLREAVPTEVVLKDYLSYLLSVAVYHYIPQASFSLLVTKMVSITLNHMANSYGDYAPVNRMTTAVHLWEKLAWAIAEEYQYIEEEKEKNKDQLPDDYPDNLDEMTDDFGGTDVRPEKEASQSDEDTEQDSKSDEDEGEPAQSPEDSGEDEEDGSEDKEDTESSGSPEESEESEEDVDKDSDGESSEDDETDTDGTDEDSEDNSGDESEGELDNDGDSEDGEAGEADGGDELDNEEEDEEEDLSQFNPDSEGLHAGDDEELISEELQTAINEVIINEVEDLTQTLKDLFKDNTDVPIPPVRLANAKTAQVHPEFSNKYLDKELTWLRDIQNSIGRKTRVGEESGRIDRRRLYRHYTDNRPFKTKYKAMNRKRNVVLLVDASTSMSGDKIVYPASYSVWKIIPDTMVYKYDGNYGNTSIERVTHNGAFHTIIPRGNTPSGDSLVSVAHLHQDALVIHFTDGQPNLGISPTMAMEVCRKNYPRARFVHIVYSDRYDPMYDKVYPTIPNYSDVINLKDMKDFPEMLRKILAPLMIG